MKIISFRDLPDKKKAHNFITKSFLLSLKDTSQYQYVSKKKYFESMNKVINYILAEHMEGRMQVRMAVRDDNPSYFYAFILYKEFTDRNFVYFLYTKHIHRKEGIASKLAELYLMDYPIEYHFITEKFKSYLKSGKNEHFDLRYIDHLKFGDE